MRRAIGTKASSLQTSPHVMSDDGGSVSEVDYTTPHSRVGASGAEDDGPGDRGDSTRTPRRAIPRRRALEDGPRRQFESPAKVEMERKHNANSQTMIRPKRAMAIDIGAVKRDAPITEGHVRQLVCTCAAGSLFHRPGGAGTAVPQRRRARAGVCVCVRGGGHVPRDCR